MHVSLHDLPLYQDLSKNDAWPSYLGQMIDGEYSWVTKNVSRLNLPADLEPYLQSAIRLWETAAIVGGNRCQHFAAFSLRAILERVALLWVAHPNVKLDASDLVGRFESDNDKTRKAATDEIFTAANTQDPELQVIYSILSRYFGHISHLDRVPISFEDEKDKLLASRSITIPLFLLFDTGHCLLELVSALLKSQGEALAPVVTGRSQRVNPYKFMRLAAHVMCEKHSIGTPVKFGMLYNNIQGIKGQVGITNIYRGGMDVYRYRKDPNDEKPTHDDLAGFAVFAVGYRDKNDIKVKLIEEKQKGERWRIGWGKTFEIDGSCLAMKASDNTGALPFFDYVSSFIKAIKSHNDQKKVS